MDKGYKEYVSGTDWIQHTFVSDWKFTPIERKRRGRDDLELIYGQYVSASQPRIENLW